MKTLLNAAALAAAITAPLPALAAPALPDADPAIWVVKDRDTTVYLFGTFHVLDGKVDWFNDEVKQAFDRADEVVVEILAGDDPAAAAPLIERYALNRSGTPWSTKLSPAARDKLAALLRSAGAPPTALDKFKPGFAGLSIAMMIYQSLGMTGDKGTEAVLTRHARSAGKRLGELEGLEAQLKMLDRIPEAAHLASLEYSLATIQDVPGYIARMRQYWNAGDAEGFARLLREVDRASPEAYRVMMPERNAAWADWVKRRMAKPGTVFVAVGTGHLAGQDSVQAFLARQGLKASRIKAN